MNRPKTIQIFLPDGSPRSIKIASITTAIAEAILIPRNKLKEASSRKELENPGIYFLFGEVDDIGKRDVYIEAENCCKRLIQHNNSDKEFWTTAISFISKIDNLNKAHIKYLEYYCCKKAKEINRCYLTNTTAPKKNKISENDEADLMDFFDTLKILVGTLGFHIFEGLRVENRKDILICKGKDALAEGQYTDEGLIVFKGSKCNLKESQPNDAWLVKVRKKLIDKHLLALQENVYVFQEDYLFSSPSAAAAVVLARRANGWTEWKDKSGKTLDELKRK